MKINENLALFLIGIATLVMTTLFLFGLGSKQTAVLNEVNEQAQVRSVQASPTPQALLPTPVPVVIQAPVEQVANPEEEQTQEALQEEAQDEALQEEAPQEDVSPDDSRHMGALDRQVMVTIEKASAYLGRGKYDEHEHIDLLERLSFYSDSSSIRPEDQEAARQLVKDMNRLLMLKDSVSRQVKLTAQINAAETDALIHVASGTRNKAEARKLMDRIEALYSIEGLTPEQNRKLKSALAALRKAYSSSATTTATTTAAKTTAAKSTSKSSAPTTATQTTAAPAAPAAPAAQTTAKSSAPAPTAAQTTAKSSAPAPTATQPTAKSSAPAPVAAQTTVKPAAKTSTDTGSSEIVVEYYKIATSVSQYISQRRYDDVKHAQYIRDLERINVHADQLPQSDRSRLNYYINELKRIDLLVNSK